MGETSDEAFHRKEAERFRRLAELSASTSLQRELTSIVARHDRLALKAASQDRVDGWGGSGRPMPKTYRLHFVGPGTVAVTHEFEAETDIEALANAYSLLDACSDLYQHFHLWQDLRVIARSTDRRGPKFLPHLDLNLVSAQMQDRVLQTEEALLQSRQAIAETRKLLSATAELREKITRREGLGPQGTGTQAAHFGSLRRPARLSHAISLAQSATLLGRRGPKL
jgi:hypothetical protein